MCLHRLWRVAEYNIIVERLSLGVLSSSYIRSRVAAISTRYYCARVLKFSVEKSSEGKA